MVGLARPDVFLSFSVFLGDFSKSKCCGVVPVGSKPMEFSVYTVLKLSCQIFHSDGRFFAVYRLTRNAWQSLAYSPIGAIVSPPSEYL